MLTNSKTGIAFSIVAIAGVIVLFASGPLAATHPAVASTTSASIAPVAGADTHQTINVRRRSPPFFLLIQDCPS
jgi:hypothetical protein